MTPAILFIVFNRPHLTSQVLAAIRAARPTRLYVAADGPRSSRDGELEKCAEARRIATAIDWPCEVRTLFREANLGCRIGVSSAIDWFFEHEEEGIILEDDCVPAPTFFPFCSSLLERYRSNDRIMAVCGSCYSEFGQDDGPSYYFSYYADMWGWATWRRAWRHYDRDLDRWPAFRSTGGVASVLGGAKWRGLHWSRYFDQTAAGAIDTWDYQWIFSVMERGGLACFPAHNLVSNIGFGPDATHTITSAAGKRPSLASRPVGELAFPLRHPTVVARSDKLDRQIEKVRLGFVPPSVAFIVLWRSRLQRLKSSPTLFLRGLVRRLNPPQGAEP